MIPESESERIAAQEADEDRREQLDRWMDNRRYFEDVYYSLRPVSAPLLGRDLDA